MFCNVGVEFQRIYAENSVKTEDAIMLLVQFACSCFPSFMNIHRFVFQAINRAGISSNYTFMCFGVDRTPPTGGHVMDGHKSNVSVNLKVKLNAYNNV